MACKFLTYLFEFFTFFLQVQNVHGVPEKLQQNRLQRLLQLRKKSHLMRILTTMMIKKKRNQLPRKHLQRKVCLLTVEISGSFCYSDITWINFVILNVRPNRTVQQVSAEIIRLNVRSTLARVQCGQIHENTSFGGNCRTVRFGQTTFLADRS